MLGADLLDSCFNSHKDSIMPTAAELAARSAARAKTKHRELSYAERLQLQEKERGEQGEFHAIYFWDGSRLLTISIPHLTSNTESHFPSPILQYSRTMLSRP